MPKHPPDEPMTKITLNLFTSDVESFRRRYGYGWSEQMRIVIHKDVKDWARQKRVMDLVADEEESFDLIHGDKRGK